MPCSGGLLVKYYRLFSWTVQYKHVLEAPKPVNVHEGTDNTIRERP
jgi:hypothetical protein